MANHSQPPEYPPVATGAHNIRQRCDEGRKRRVGGVSALMYAAQQGNVEKVRKIIREQPSTLFDQDRTGKLPLHYCTTSGNIRAAQAADLMVMAAPDLVDSRDEDGFTPLHLAVIAGNMQLVTFLLANNADVNAVDNEKHSVVHWATVCGETAALRAVLAAGAPVSTPDVHGGYPLHYAAQMCGGDRDSNLGLQVLQTLLTHSDIQVSVTDGDKRQPLLWAASAGSARAVLALIRAGAAVEAADKDGLTALHCAASRGHTDCMDTLLTLCGSSPDVIDSNGCTALHYAVTLGHADATALLLSHGADSNRQDRKGRSPAHCGCAKGQFETVKLIGSHGANLWLRNARGDLPLHDAAASGRRDLVKFLLEMRPSQVNARNNDGRCPLHMAALNDNADMCKILLDAGAQINPVLRTSKNMFMTPLDCALQRGFRSTAKYLQLHGGVPATRIGDQRNQSLNLQIRDDITFWGDTSSENERENGEVVKSGRRLYRKKLGQKYDRKRASVSSSEKETRVRSGKLEQKIKRKSSEKINSQRPSSKLESAASSKRSNSSKMVSSTRVNYNNEIIINGKTEINIHQTKDVIIDKENRPVENTNSVNPNEVAPTIAEKERRPRSAKYSRLRSAKSVTEKEIERATRGTVISPESLIQLEGLKKELSLKDKSTNTSEETVIENKVLNTLPLKEDTFDKEDSLLRDSDEINVTKFKLHDQQSMMSYTSEETDDHKKDLIVEASVHAPPTSMKELATIDHQQEHKPVELNDSSSNNHLEGSNLDNEVQVENSQKESVQNEEPSLDSKEPLKTDDVKEKIDIRDSVAQQEKTEFDTTADLENDLIKKENEQKEINQSDIINDNKVELEKEILTKEQSHLQEESPIVHQSQIENEDTSNINNKISVEENVTLQGNNDSNENIDGKTEKSDPFNEKSVQEESSITQENLINPITEENSSKIQENGTTEDTVHVLKTEESGEKEEHTIHRGDNEVSQPKEICEENKGESKKQEHEETLRKISEESEGQLSTKNEDEKISTDVKLGEKLLTENIHKEVEHKKKTDRDANNDAPSKEKSKLKHNSDERRKVVKIPNQVKSEAKLSSKQKQKRHKKSENEEDSSNSDGSSVSPEKSHKSFRVLNEEEAEKLEKHVPKRKKGRSLLKETRSHSDETKPAITNKIQGRARRSKIPTPLFKSTLSKSDRHLDIINQENKLGVVLDARVPSLPNIHDERHHLREPPRCESNMSAPLLTSLYSDNERDSISDPEEKPRSLSKSKRLVKRRSRAREARSAGSDYESSNLIDSGFEPSPRSTRIPRWKNVSERGVNMTSVTQNIQNNIRRYHLERKIFQHLLELKRHQIRAGQHNEAVLVKRAIDDYHRSCASTVGAGRYIAEDFTFKSFEKFLYEALRKLQKNTNGADAMKGLPDASSNPLLCTRSTNRCMHATHAYTGVPCAAYLPKMDHHTIPKIGFNSVNCKPGTGFLPTIGNSKKAVTLELSHGPDKQIISLPTDRLDQSKRYYVTFTVKGHEPSLQMMTLIITIVTLKVVLTDMLKVTEVFHKVHEVVENE